MRKSFEIKGTFAYEAISEYDAGNLLIGASIKLEKEPGNIHDRNAVIVRLGKNSAKLGYIPREESHFVSECLASNVRYEAKIDQVKHSSDKGKRKLFVLIALALFVDRIVDLSGSTEISIPTYYTGDETCFKCNKRIGNNPSIIIDENLYCYKCSKKGLDGIQDTKYTEAWDKYNIINNEFQKEKKIYEEKLAVWSENLTQAIKLESKSKAFIYWMVIIVLAVVGYFLFPDGGVLWGIILGGVFCFWHSMRIMDEDKIKQDLLREEYLLKNPMPHFTRIMPDPPSIKEDFIIPGSEINTIDSYNRNAILRRDKFQCHRCRKKRPSDDLEVHHIIPRSKGGTNDHNNLITLCKYCHDRESWFGHSRAYPTTFK